MKQLQWFWMMTMMNLLSERGNCVQKKNRNKRTLLNDSKQQVWWHTETMLLTTCCMTDINCCANCVCKIAQNSLVWVWVLILMEPTSNELDSLSCVLTSSARAHEPLALCASGWHPPCQRETSALSWDTLLEGARRCSSHTACRPLNS